MRTITTMHNVDGGLGAVKGLQATGIWAGFRRNPARRDLALIVAPPGSTAAGVFTRSNFAAAPVLLCRRHLAALTDSHAESHLSPEAGATVNAGDKAETRGFRALVINSGNANAATGSLGMEVAEKTCELTAQLIGAEPEEILVASTGVIGVQLPFEKFSNGLPQAFATLSAGERGGIEGGRAAAEAIMTTDTVPKMAARSFTVPGTDGSDVTYTVGGMAKGSGMIAPHMATMIAVLATDARIEQPLLQQALKEAVDVSFNKVTIDSDMSTNDSAYLIATGAAVSVAEQAQQDGTPCEFLQPNSAASATFKAALIEVCQDLAYQIARDGEGATKVIVVDVEGAASDDDAERVARAIADSPLVKTAIAGHDANWGRIAMAAGKAGASFKREDVSISIMDMEVLSLGLPVAFSEEEALKRFAERDEVHIVVNLRAGTARTRIWTCDLTKEYVAINGDYRT